MSCLFPAWILGAPGEKAQQSATLAQRCACLPGSLSPILSPCAFCFTPSIFAPPFDLLSPHQISDSLTPHQRRPLQFISLSSDRIPTSGHSVVVPARTIHSPPPIVCFSPLFSHSLHTFSAWDNTYALDIILHLLQFLILVLASRSA